jgi:phosphoribosylaminoimidazole-succinocarboxamide synthase
VISNRYIELYEKVIGKKFIPQDMSDEVKYQLIVSALEKLEF